MGVKPPSALFRASIDGDVEGLKALIEAYRENPVMHSDLKGPAVPAHPIIHKRTNEKNEKK